MKKISIILCMLAALMLVFTASAENAQMAADAVYTAEFEQLLSMLGESDEDVTNMFTILSNVVKRMSGHVAIGKNRNESTFLIDNETLLGYSYMDTSNGIEFYSSSIPSYVFRVTGEELNEIMTLISSLPEALNTLLEQIDFTVYSDMLNEFVASIGMESSECAETINDVLYTEKTVITVNGEQTKAFLRKALEQLGKDMEKLGLPVDTGSVLSEELTIGDLSAVLYTSAEGFIRVEAPSEGIVAVIDPEGSVYASVKNVILAFEMLENGTRFTLSEGDTTVQMTEVTNGDENDALIAIVIGENLIEVESVSKVTKTDVESCIVLRMNTAELLRCDVLANSGMNDMNMSFKMTMLGAEKEFYGVNMAMYESEEEMIGYTAPEDAVVITLADLMDIENLSSIAGSMLTDSLVGMFDQLLILADAEPALAPYIEELAGSVANVAAE